MNESHAANIAWSHPENVSRRHFQPSCLRVPPDFSDRESLIARLRRVDAGLDQSNIDRTILEVSHEIAFSLAEHSHSGGEIARAVTSAKLEEEGVEKCTADLSMAIRNTIAFLESDGIDPNDAEAAGADWDRADLSIRTDLTVHGSPRGRLLLLWGVDQLRNAGVNLDGVPIWADPTKEDPVPSPHYTSEYVPNPEPRAKN